MEYHPYSGELVLCQRAIVGLDVIDKDLSVLQRPHLVWRSKEEPVEVWITRVAQAAEL